MARAALRIIQGLEEAVTMAKQNASVSPPGDGEISEIDPTVVMALRVLELAVESVRDGSSEGAALDVAREFWEFVSVG